jgi:hypothetical protein
MNTNPEIPKNTTGLEPEKPQNVGGEVQFTDSNSVSTGEFIDVKYTYEVEYVDVNTAQKSSTPGDGPKFDIIPEGGSPDSYTLGSMRIEDQGLLKTVKIDFNFITDTGEQIQFYHEIDGGLSATYTELADEAIVVIGNKLVNEYNINPPIEAREEQVEFVTTTEIQVIVGNNANLPNYAYRPKARLLLDKTTNKPVREVITPEQAVKLATQMFEQNPPKIEPPSADIYFVDEETGEIVIESDYYGQTYPPEGATVEFVAALEPIPFSFSSMVVDLITNKPIPFTRVEDDNGNFAVTDVNGLFTLQGEYIPGEIQNITITNKQTDPSYNSEVIPITTLEGSLRSDINFIPLKSSENDSSASELAAKATSEEEKDRLTKEDIANFVAKVVDEVQNQINTRLIPFAIKKLLCEPFGVCDPIGMVKQAKKLAKDAKAKKEQLKAQNEQRKADKEQRKADKKAGKEEEEQPKSNKEKLAEASGQYDPLGGLQTDDRFTDLTPPPEGYVSDFTFTPQSSLQDFFRDFDDDETTVPTGSISTEKGISGDTPDDPLKVPWKPKIKIKLPKRKVKFKYPKPKPTILKRGGKFRSKGNKRAYKKVKFSGRKR